MMKQLLLIGTVGFLLFEALLAQEQQSEQPATQPSQNQTDNPPDPDSETNAEDSSKITDLPLLEDLEIPSAEELLTGEEVTWIIVEGDRVLFSRSISPRPHTLEKQAEELEVLRTQRTPNDPEKKKEFTDKLIRLRHVRGGFPGNSEFPEFLIEVAKVKDIWHHEDLMVKRAELLMADHKLNEAYEVLFTLQTINSTWPGLEEQHHKLIFLDAEALWDGNDREAGLARYEELYRLDPKYPGLLDRLADCTNQLIEAALQSEDYRRARYFLHRLEKISSDHNVVQTWQKNLSELMQTTLQQARDARDRQELAQAAALVERAAEIWPDNIELRDEHRRISRRYQILKSGVLRPAGIQSAYPFPGAAEERYEFLKRRPLFEIGHYDGSPRYRTTLIERWEPTELGRNLLLHLRTDFNYWSSQKPVTAVEAAETLARQLNPDSADYDERLSGDLRSIQVHSPYQLELEFTRAPLRPEAILSRPVTRSGGWFTEIERTDRTCTWVRSIPEPEDAPVFHVAEIRELGFENHDEALRALFRGEVDYLPALPLKHVTTLQETPPWFVRKYALPETHLLQFHPESILAHRSELRRALLYALDREEILTEEILRDAPREFGRLTTSAVPTTSESYSPLVQSFEPNLRVALSLALAAAKANEGPLPTLKMIVPQDPELQPIVDRLIKRWERIGINVIVVDLAHSEDQQWDIAYRRVSLTEPLTELWPFLTMSTTPRVSDLQNLPGWLRQELIRLDLVTNWDDANTILFRLHEFLWNEVYYLPLWELDRFSISRRNLSGIPPSPLHAYDGLATWIVDPWFEQTQP